MGYFSNIKKTRKQPTISTQKIIEQAYKANPGDMVIYCKAGKTYDVVNAPLDNYKYTNDEIPIGITLSQDDEYNTVVLLGGFLSAEPLHVPDSYYGNSDCIALYVKSTFERYENMHRKMRPEIKALKKLRLRFPTLADMRNIVNNKDKIINSFQVLYGNERNDKFFDDLLHSYMYVNDDGLTRLWGCPQRTGENIKELDFTPGRLLSLTTIKLNK